MYLSERVHPKNLIFVLISMAFAAQTACAGLTHKAHKAGDVEGGSKVMVNERLKLTVEVTSFRPEAMHDDFLDGTSMSYGLTMLTIIEPASYKGQQLTIVHSSTPAPDSIWASVGQTCVIEIDKRLLADSAILIPPGAVTVVADRE
jgi:hypothetical protein